MGGRVESDDRPRLPVVPVLVISGPVGVGKTTTAAAVSSLLAEQNIRHAVIDLPQIGGLFPPPEHDEWNDEVTDQNLACMWTNFRSAGAERLIISRVLGYRSGVQRIETAVAGAQVIVVRLRAPLDVIHGRIRSRSQGNDDWHLNAATELSHSMDEQPIEDHLIENGTLSIAETARAVLRITGWAGPADALEARADDRLEHGVERANLSANERSGHAQTSRAAAEYRSVMPLGVVAGRGTAMRLLVVTGAAVASLEQLPRSIRALIEAASELFIITPILPTRLQWLTNDTDAYQQIADARLNAVLGRVQEVNAAAAAEGHVRADDVLTAFTDAIHEFHPDHILIGLRTSDQTTWQEHGLADAVIGNFHLPTTVFEIDTHDSDAPSEHPGAPRHDH